MKLNEIIDNMYVIREAIRDTKQKLKEHEEDLKELKLEFQAKCAEAGTDYARGELASASLTEQVVPVIDDWGKVSEYIMENDALYLVHRRISAGPWKELLDMGDEVPGIEPFTKKDVSLRKLGDKNG